LPSASAIALMSVYRCLDPPGGAAALLAALAVGTGISFAAARAGVSNS
jgi:CBS-domain-containing membrane protein